MHTYRRNGLIGRQPTRSADHIGRRAPMIVGSLVCGLLAFAYLYAISIKNVPLAFVLCVLMWGVVYQGYNAVYPSFYPELFPPALAFGVTLIAALSAFSARETYRLHLIDLGEAAAAPLNAAQYAELRRQPASAG